MLRLANQDKVITFDQYFGHDKLEENKYLKNVCVVMYNDVSYEAQFDNLWVHLSVLSADTLGINMAGTISFKDRVPEINRSNHDANLSINMNFFELYRDAAYINNGGVNNLLMSLFSDINAANSRIYSTALVGWHADLTLNTSVYDYSDIGETSVFCSNYLTADRKLGLTLNTWEALGIQSTFNRYLNYDVISIALRKASIRINTLMTCPSDMFTEKFVKSLEKKLLNIYIPLYNHFNKEVYTLC